MRSGDESEYDQVRAQDLAEWGFVILLEPFLSDDKVEGAPENHENEQKEEVEKEEVEMVPEKNEFSPFPEKDKQPKKRGRKPSR